MPIPEYDNTIWESWRYKGRRVTHTEFDFAQYSAEITSHMNALDDSKYWIPDEIVHSEAAVLMHILMNGVQVKRFFIVVVLCVVNCRNIWTVCDIPKAEREYRISYYLTYKCVKALKQFHGSNGIYMTKNVKAYIKKRREENDARKRKATDRKISKAVHTKRPAAKPERHVLRYRRQ